jgi:hypothetical protein
MTDFQQGVIAATETAVHILREWGKHGTIRRIDERALTDLIVDVQRRTPRPPAASAEISFRRDIDIAEDIVKHARQAPPLSASEPAGAPSEDALTQAIYETRNLTYAEQARAVMVLLQWGKK